MLCYMLCCMLCPGFFSCPELVEETAHALTSSHKHKHSGFVTRLLAEGGEGGENDEGGEAPSYGSVTGGLQRQGSLTRQTTLVRQATRRFKRKGHVGFVPLMSTATPYAEYVRTCPPDLKDVGLFEVHRAQCPMPSILCPMPNAQCLMPRAQCPGPDAQCPMPTGRL